MGHLTKTQKQNKSYETKFLEKLDKSLLSEKKRIVWFGLSSSDELTNRELDSLKNKSKEFEIYFENNKGHLKAYKYGLEQYGGVAIGFFPIQE